MPDGAVKTIGLFVESLDRVQVVIGGLADRVQFGQCIGDREHRLLHRGIEQVAAGPAAVACEQPCDVLAVKFVFFPGCAHAMAAAPAA